MSIKAGLFFLTICYIISPISGIIDHYCIIKNFKNKSGKNKKKLRTIESNFTGSYIKASVPSYLLMKIIKMEIKFSVFKG